jgi:ankyrin repeat protein
VRILAANIHGITAYGWACSNGNLALMKVLEDAGGDDTHLKRWNGLFSAVSSNKIKAVNHILKRGVSVNISSIQSGNSPLHFAAKYGYTDMIRFLLDNGANPNAANYMKETPLYIAVQSGHLYAVKEILTCPNIYMTRAAVDTGLTAPMVCIQEMYNTIRQADEDKFMEIFISLYERGINTVVRPSTSIFGRMNIIEYSLALQQYNIFFMLVDSIRYINATSPTHKYTPLHFATFYSAPVGVILSLLDKGANINAVSDNQHTPLYCALYRHNDDVVKLLLDRGANPNILISQVPLIQYTMLHYAKEPTLYDIITYMIEKGADIHMKGETTCLMSAAVIGDITLIRYCLLRGCDINAQRLDGTTSLMLAASNGHFACVEDLVAAGADYMRKNDKGKTALTLATEKEYDIIAEYLAKTMGLFDR